jgi:hypothetical protein
MNSRNAKLIEDRYQSHPLLVELKATLAAAEQFSTRAAAIKSDAHLSVSGRNAKTEKLVRATLRDLRDLASPVDAKRAALAGVLAKIKPASFDKSDLASAILRQEMRAAVRNMSLSERAAILLGDQADVAFVDSILEAPAILSGLDAHLYEEVREQRLQSMFSAEAAEAESLTNEVAEADAIFELAHQDVAAASGLQPYEFTAIQKQVAERKDAPWLRKEKNQNGEEIVIVVPVAGGGARLATADEQRDGQYFANLAEYRASRAA